MTSNPSEECQDLASKPTNNVPSETRSKRFQCEKCEAQFTQFANLRRHHLAAHANNGFRPFRCTLCLQRFVRKDHLLEHLIRRHTPSPHRESEQRDATLSYCPFCCASHDDTGHLRHHLLSKHSDLICNRTEPSNSVSVHGEATSDDMSSRRVTMVEYTANTPTIIIEHQPQGVLRSPHYCEICGIDFNDSIFIGLHRGYHSFQRPFRCNYCGVNFANKYEFNAHIFSHAHC